VTSDYTYILFNLILTQSNLTDILCVNLNFNLILALHTTLIISQAIYPLKVLTESKHWCKFDGITYDTEFNVHYM